MTQPNENLTPESTAIRLGMVEKELNLIKARYKFLEDSFRDLVDVVQKSQASQTKNMMRALAGVFHNLSDDLTNASEGPKAYHYVAEEVPVGTETSIIVKRTGDHYDFSTSHDPEKIRNENTEELVILFKQNQLVADGETKWFHLSYQNAEQVNGTDPTPAGESEVSA